MKKQQLMILLLGFSLCFPTYIFAETIILKSGKVIEAKILERTDEYIKIELDGIPIYYEHKYIKSIHEDSDSSIADFDVSSISSYFERAVEYVSRGDFEAARNELYMGMKINPSNTNLQNGLQILYDLDRGLIGRDYATYFFKGLYYMMNEQYQLAITELLRAHAINDSHAETSYYLGNAYFNLGQYQGAATFFKKVLEIQPKDDESSYRLGVIYTSSGNYQEAITYAQKTLEINPGYTGAYYLLGVSYYSLGEYQRAKDNLIVLRGLLHKQGDSGKVKEIDSLLDKISEVAGDISG